MLYHYFSDIGINIYLKHLCKSHSNYKLVNSLRAETVRLRSSSMPVYAPLCEVLVPTPDKQQSSLETSSIPDYWTQTTFVFELVGHE